MAGCTLRPHNCGIGSLTWGCTPFEDVGRTGHTAAGASAAIAAEDIGNIGQRDTVGNAASCMRIGSLAERRSANTGEKKSVTMSVVEWKHEATMKDLARYGDGQYPRF